MRAYMITRGITLPERTLWQIERAIDAGVDRVQIRAKDKPGGLVEELVREIVRRRPAARRRILVNDRLDVALATGAGGVHLPATGFRAGRVREVAPEGLVIGVSTHTLSEVREAAEGGADFLVFGPVFPTTSKPGHPGVGLERLREAVRASTIPVYAIGGVTVERVPALVAAGAGGIAGISLFESPERLSGLMRCLQR